MARECCCCAFIVALFCPPLAVLMMEGCGVDFCLNLLLTFIFWLPGMIHAFIVILRDPQPAATTTIIHSHTTMAAPAPAAAPVVINLQNDPNNYPQPQPMMYQGFPPQPPHPQHQSFASAPPPYPMYPESK